MEQKKTLWIIAAVGAFLLVVLGAAWIVYTPKTYDNPAAVTKAADRDSRTSTIQTAQGWNNSSENVPVPPAPEYNQINADKVDVLANNASLYVVQKDSDESTTIDLNQLKQKSLEQNTPQNINLTVNIDGKTAHTESVKVRKPESVESKPTENKAPASVPAVKKSAPSKTVAAKSTPVESTKKIVQYWVQVAAYGDKKHADTAKSVLDANKIPSDIFTYQDNKGKLFYRVRVGPYTTKSEAEYWRTRIIKIDDFAKAESYVTSTTN